MRRCKKIVTRFIAVALVAMMIMPIITIPASAADIVLDKTWTLYMVPNTHLDTAWQHPYKEVAQGGNAYSGNNGLRPMLANAISRLNANPSFIFTTSASKHYEWAKDWYDADNPDGRVYWPEVKKLVAAGQWDITGGQIVEPDLNMPSGESFARQSLYAQHFFEREFGKQSVPKVGFVPDVFGFAGQLPQVLYKSEMPYFVTSKVNWSERTGISAYYEDPESGDNVWRNHRGNDDIGTTRRGRQSDVWWWQGLDGKSSVLSNFMCYDYNWQEGRGPLEGVFEQNWQDGYETGIKIGLFFYGGGDFGQGLRDNSGNNSFAYVNEVANNANTRFTAVAKGTTGFFEDLMDIVKTDKAAVAAGADPAIKIPTHKGEIYLEYHRGTYTSWARIKEYNRKHEILAESTEKAATAAFYTGARATNSSDTIEWAWNRVLTDQMHDVLPGAAVAYQFYQSFNLQEQSRNLFNSVRNNSLSALAYRADTNVTGKPVFVFNELSWTRDGEVTVDLKYNVLPAGIRIFDGATELYPSKVVRKESANILTVTFVAKGVPATGYKVFDVREGVAPAQSSTLVVDAANLTFSNEFLRMQFNPATGYISSLRYDGREMLAQGVGFEGAELHVYRDCEERPDQGFDQWELNLREMNQEPSWIFDAPPLSIDIIENTPAKVTVRVVKMWNGSVVTQDFSMYPGVDRVDVNLNAEWFQTKRLLKVSFPINADNSFATYDAAYGAVERPTDRITPFQQARYEVPGHKWIDVTDKSGEFGLSLLNDSKYGFDSWRRTVGDNTFVRSRITVCRTPRAQSFAGNSTFNPSSPYVIDSGVHNFNYSIAPHTGGWESANTVNKAYEFSTPMKAFEAAKTPASGLGASESFASASPKNVVMSAFKNQYDNQGDKNTIVVRVYEATGKDTNNVTITLPGNVISAKEVNILEHEYDTNAPGYEDFVPKTITSAGKTITFNIGKYEVVTIEAKIEGFAGAALPAAQQRAIDLSSYYNQRATAPRNNKRAAYVEGEGTTASPGFSMPEKSWPAGVGGIDYEGIKFDIGPVNANNIVAGAAGAKVDIASPAAGFSKMYVIGFSTARFSNTIAGNANNGAQPTTGSVTVNYSIGNPTTKTIDFNSWRTDLSGWDRYAWADTKPYVYDTIAHVNTFFQQSTAAATSQDHLTNENYMFIYTIDVDSSRAISSIDLPASSNIKIVAITLADPLPGLGWVYDAASVGPLTNVTPNAPSGVAAAYEPRSNNLKSLVTWNPVPGAYKYRVYGARTPDFTVGTANQLGDTISTSYGHVLPFGVTLDDVTNGNDKMYYKVVAITRSVTAASAAAGSDILSAASVASNPVVITNIDYCLNITNGDANAALVNQGGQQSTTLAGWKATNGVWTTVNDKWSNNTVGNGNAWLSVRVGHNGLKSIKGFLLAHGGVGPFSESHNGANRKYSIWYSNDSTNGNPNNGTWVQLVNEPNNFATISTHSLDSVVAVDWVQVRIDPYRGGWRGATGGSGATYGTAWLYGFSAVAENPNAGIATVANGSISVTPGAGTMSLKVSYDYSGPSAEGATAFKWFQKYEDYYGALYVPVVGGTGSTISQTNIEVGKTVGYKCEVTPVDASGNLGKPVSFEIDSPLSTAINGKITPKIFFQSVDLELSYDYFNELNFDSSGAPLATPVKQENSSYQWLKKTAIEPNGKFVPIPGATGKILSQTKAEIAAAEAYRCEISVFDTDGAKGKVVAVDLDAFNNIILGAAVTSQTRTGAANLVDGALSTKWEVATTTYPGPHTAVFDLGAVMVVDRFKVFHSPSNPFVDVDGDMARFNDKNPRAITYDFDVSYSLNANGPWTTETIRANLLPITDIKLASRVNARYIKIDVIRPNRVFTSPTNFWDTTNRLRILELQALVGVLGTLNPPVTLYHEGTIVPIASASGKTVDVKLSVGSIPAGKANVLAAIYSNTGVMLGVKQEVVDIGAAGIIDFTFADYAIPANAAAMRVFIWDVDTYVPITEAFIVG